ncbi:protein of unknown function DUF3741 [Dillenia turbinata]|uniref:DUF4378 domain-containing protein n=1 Tax=Dillenia turbinata TaxID=194707 RepID=A0AAN8WBX6_9MAGN
MLYDLELYVYVGNRMVQKQRTHRKSESQSSSCSSTITDEDLLMLEMRRTSSRHPGGTPIKELLAEEILKEAEYVRRSRGVVSSKEAEHRGRSPGVVARLMGLDGLPSQQSIHKQQKPILENHVRRVTPIDYQIDGIPGEGRSYRKSTKEQQVYKDVFEVVETSKVERVSSCLQGYAEPKLTEVEKVFFQQKFLDAQRLSAVEKLHGSKEFLDALEALDSDKDLSVKFLQEPDSLFSKHLQNLDAASGGSHFARTPEVRSSVYSKNGIRRNLDRHTVRKDNVGYPLKNQHGPTGYSYESCSYDSVKPLRARAGEKAEKCATVPPTRIVVLKPNFNLAQSARTSNSSPPGSFISEHGKPVDLISIADRDVELKEKKYMHNDAGISGHDSKESRELAKEITKQMKRSLSRRSVGLLGSKYRGYAGDESSCYSGSESASDSDTTILSSKKSFDWKNRYRSSSSRSTESAVNREAKKRLSERWKMTHRSLDMDMVGRGSTLGEMLANSDRENGAENLAAMTVHARSCERMAMNNYVGPVGISSKDGWKDGCINDLSRSRSLPASSTAFGSPKTSMQQDSSVVDKFIMPKNSFNKRRNQELVNKKEGPSRKLRSSSKKSHSPPCTKREGGHTSWEIHLCHNQKISNFAEDCPNKQKHVISGANGDDDNANLLLPEAVGQEPQNSVASPQQFLAESMTYMLEKDDLPAADSGYSVLQKPSMESSEECSDLLLHPIPEIESTVSSKEADQPSPISVLEAPFLEDPHSGAECFESLSADLHGLRLQLQLLKLESEAYSEGQMVLSSDEDGEERSVGGPEEKDVSETYRSKEFWMTSYLNDVLLDSGFNETELDCFIGTWYSSECPMGPSVFEKLEKKYNDQTTWAKSERKMFFDRINSGLVEVFRPFMDPHPWANSSSRLVVSKWRIDKLEEELRVLLASQENKRDAEKMEWVLQEQCWWLDLGDDVDVIGSEIERMLLDDLFREIHAL